MLPTILAVSLPSIGNPQIEVHGLILWSIRISFTAIYSAKLEMVPSLPFVWGVVWLLSSQSYFLPLVRHWQQQRCLHCWCWNSLHDSWSLNFRRLLKDDEIEEWANFLHLMPGIQLTIDLDFCSWKLKSNGPFTTTFLLSHLASSIPSTVSAIYKQIWKSHCIKRIKVLMWETGHSCLNTMDRLPARYPWINLSSSWCCLCQNSSELLDHLFFHYLHMLSGQKFSRLLVGAQSTLMTLWRGSECCYWIIPSKIFRQSIGTTFAWFCPRLGRKEMIESSKVVQSPPNTS